MGNATMVGDPQRQKVDDGKQEKLLENEREMSDGVSEFMLPCICCPTREDPRRAQRPQSVSWTKAMVNSLTGAYIRQLI